MNGSSVYLEFGKPAQEGEFRILLSLAQPTDLQNDNSLFDFQDLGEYPIDGSAKL